MELSRHLFPILFLLHLGRHTCQLLFLNEWAKYIVIDNKIAPHKMHKRKEPFFARLRFLFLCWAIVLLDFNKTSVLCSIFNSWILQCKKFHLHIVVVTMSFFTLDYWTSSALPVFQWMIQTFIAFYRLQTLLESCLQFW